MINLKGIIGKDIDQIWEDFIEEDFCKYPPCSVESIELSDLIFIGINPSTNEKEKMRLNAKKDRSCEFYLNEMNIDATHKYFKKFFDIAQQTQSTWTHLDLLYLKETKQSRVKELLKSSKGIDFIYRQLMLSKKVLESVLADDKPKIFIVNNTLAREFLGKDRPSSYSDEQKHWMDYRFKWDEELGTYRLGKHIFFFTSMLTGQRALDNGSYQRLIWHINFVKRKLE
ncbi:hypothetical protein [Leeuwenhoekiella marinoflava]|uniref:hypothetical protein n=1 Tax=Leeuwenhoekiella marinoflava TaxID=988 RepID=UPI0030034AA2